MDPVKQQYESHPYPPIPRLALPGRREGKELSYEHGTALRDGQASSSRGIRIAVAGCGTFEPVLVAQVHPQAREILAVDLSETSLRRARQRAVWARLTLRNLAPLTFVAADLLAWAKEQSQREPFDYVIASNVLHHVPLPAEVFRSLAAILRPGGLMRVVTYPKASRLWMRETSRVLKNAGLTPESPQLVRRAKEVIARLPKDDPARTTFETHQEAGTAAGLVDAFLHAWERPLAPMEWARLCRACGLTLFSEGQSESSRSSFLDEIVPAASGLDPWAKLEVLDCLLELCANPILWLTKTGEPGGPDSDLSFSEEETRASVLCELRGNLVRAEGLLAVAGVCVRDAFYRFKREVGPRVSPFDQDRVLPGLAITDYDFEELMNAR